MQLMLPVRAHNTHSANDFSVGRNLVRFRLLAPQLLVVEIRSDFNCDRTTSISLGFSDWVIVLIVVEVEKIDRRLVVVVAARIVAHEFVGIYI